jgi:hypothetical protein
VALDLRHRQVDLGARFVAVSPSPTPAALRTDAAVIWTLGKGDPSRSSSSLPAIPPPMLVESATITSFVMVKLSALHVGTAAYRAADRIFADAAVLPKIRYNSS